MTIRIRLKAEEREEVERTFRGTPDRRLRDRCRAVLMADRGRRRGQIAADLGVHRAAVHRRLRAYRARGLAGLRIKWAAGPPPPRLPERSGPRRSWPGSGTGRRAAGWSGRAGPTAELATHPSRVHGIGVRETAVRAFCRRHGVRPYRPTYRPLPAWRPQAPGGRAGGPGGAQKSHAR